jgi:predicted transcriptional regulator
MAEENRTAALSYRVRPSLKAALEELAEKERRPLSQYLELVLEAHVEAKRAEQKRGKR